MIRYKVEVSIRHERRPVVYLNIHIPLACINNTVSGGGWGGAELNGILYICNESEARNVYAILIVTFKLRDYLGEYVYA